MSSFCPLDLKKSLTPETKQRIQVWLEGNFDSQTKKELALLLNENEQEVMNAFYKHLSFGTGGLRGIVGIGPNRINRYTIRAASQAVAEELLESDVENPSVIIGFDSRIHSLELAQEAASVFAQNGVMTYLFTHLCPAPLLSFACREKKCTRGIMITASHNPPKYNGYKVFGENGAQILPSQAKTVLAKINTYKDPSAILLASLSHPLIQHIADDMDDAYCQASLKMQSLQEQDRNFGSSLNVIYSPLHGTGGRLMTKMMDLWGFSKYSLVSKQAIPNGHFPTVQLPNPEEPSAMVLGTKQLEEENGDLFIATDPDADRMGVVVRDSKNSHMLNGHQIACLLLDHACRHEKADPSTLFAIKTLATTELFRKMAASYGIRCYDVLNGFKYIAQKIDQEENQRNTFLLGAESSHGYLYKNLTRDKDGILSSALLLEAALDAKQHQKTLIDRLFELYRIFGVHINQIESLQFPDTKQGREDLDSVLKKLQSNPMTKIGEIPVIQIDNFALSETTHLPLGTQTSLDYPKDPLLIFWLEDGSKLLVRPSGTEPKLKLYVEVAIAPKQDVNAALQEGQIRAANLLTSLRTLA